MNDFNAILTKIISYLNIDALSGTINIRVFILVYLNANFYY